jgi:hypothetical protein
MYQLISLGWGFLFAAWFMWSPRGRKFVCVQKGSIPTSADNRVSVSTSPYVANEQWRHSKGTRDWNSTTNCLGARHWLLVQTAERSNGHERKEVVVAEFACREWGKPKRKALRSKRLVSLSGFEGNTSWIQVQREGAAQLWKVPRHSLVSEIIKVHSYVTMVHPMSIKFRSCVRWKKTFRKLYPHNCRTVT